jgi:hypothetical protein
MVSLDQSIWAPHILLEGFPKWCVHQSQVFLDEALHIISQSTTNVVKYSRVALPTL